MTTDQLLWVVARVAGLASYATLAIALLSGIALRTAVLDWMGSNRALRSMHEYTTYLWISLGVVHIGGLLLDHTARIGVLDVFVPFRAPYGTLAVGLGSLSIDVLIVVTVTAWLRRRLRPDWWRWLHRLSYVAFAFMFLHAVLSGTDFSDPAVSAITWGAAAALLALTVVRAVWGRLPATF
jgi:methionine sulfoxide reductase heme-binding subunit